MRTRIPRAAAVEQAMGRGISIFDPAFRGSPAQDAFVALVDEFLAFTEVAHG